MSCRRQRISQGELDRLEAGGPDAAAPDEKAEKEEDVNTQALQQLIAKVLVDPNTSIPLDSAALHRKASSLVLQSSHNCNSLPGEEGGLKS